MVENDAGGFTGRGVCEYKDEEVANSARRNLSGMEMRGRILKIEGSGGSSTSSSSSSSSSSSQAGATGFDQASRDAAGAGGDSARSLQHLPPAEAVEKVIGQLSDTELHELLWHTKQLIIENPDFAKNLLSRSPQLCFGLMQALIRLQFVSPSEAQAFFHIQQPVPQPSVPIAMIPPPSSMPPSLSAAMMTQPTIPTAAPAMPTLPIIPGFDMSMLSAQNLSDPAFLSLLTSALFPGGINPAMPITGIPSQPQPPPGNPAQLPPDLFYNPASGMPPRGN